MKIILTIFLATLSLYGIELSTKFGKIITANDTNGTINLSNLQKGQSGIITHISSDKKNIIIAYGIVTSSNENSSEIKFDYTDIFPQDAIPTTNLKVQPNDTFILNHLYTNSLLIVPNYRTLGKVKKLYSENNFLDSDIFGAFLKMNDTPAPTKNDMQEFARKNDLGTIFITTDDKLYIVDSLSFKVIDSSYFKIDDNSTEKPFYTNVEDIKTGTFSWFKEDTIGEYHTYYKNLLGIEDGK